MILRTIKCALCPTTETEPEENAGWKGWGAIQGIVLDGEPNPHVCPVCLGKVAEFADGVKHGMD